ncbi:predicted protein [Plenodomus lingam JN3]|uniref:Predicted protein n=1 Tax=Leptosphaeria maculans (strain JN3 / isolate v23.1.3 / race Av1-4-5-6-7-8) TaxID=985895 RepID=E5A0R7_LEPMJ|nr:predicted protein [Plenodomus lingam JN3]CBX97213.1 predicted protein [Plenodomus lingam JN3]
MSGAAKGTPVAGRRRPSSPQPGGETVTIIAALSACCNSNCRNSRDRPATASSGQAHATDQPWRPRPSRLSPVARCGRGCLMSWNRWVHATDLHVAQASKTPEMGDGCDWPRHAERLTRSTGRKHLNRQANGGPAGRAESGCQAASTAIAFSRWARARHWHTPPWGSSSRVKKGPSRMCAAAPCQPLSRCYLRSTVPVDRVVDVGNLYLAVPEKERKKERERERERAQLVAPHENATTAREQRRRPSPGLNSTGGLCTVPRDDVKESGVRRLSAKHSDPHVAPRPSLLAGCTFTWSLSWPILCSEPANSACQSSRSQCGFVHRVLVRANNNTRMSQPPLPPPSLPLPNTSRPPSDMTETQKLPVFSPPGFLDFPHRRLPPLDQLKPLEIPPNAVPPRSDRQFRSPSNTQLPSIHSGLPPRHDYQPPTTVHRPAAAPVEKLLLQQPNQYTPPHSNPPYSPQQYGPPISPRSEYDGRGPRRLTEQHYTYEEPRHVQHHPQQHAHVHPHSQPHPHLHPHPHSHSHSNSHPPQPHPHQHAHAHQHHEQPYSSLASPVEHSQQRAYAPLPSPGYAPSYASSSTPFRGSVGSLQHSQRGSIAAPLRSVAYSEPPAAAPPPRKQSRTIPLPGSIPQPVYNEQLNLNYELRVRQQPIAARACGFGERDRRVIDPPPIIQLLVTDPKTGAAEPEELRYSLNVVHCTLWNAEGTNEETALVQPDRRTTRRLMGQLVASPSVAKDEHDVEGCFFCFPDLSCRTHGKYRLRFVLMRIDPMNLHVGGFSPILTEVLSDVFTVYTAKDFPGMRPSSALTRALKLQGCNIQVKKGNEKALARKRLTTSQEHDSIDDEEQKRRRRD